MKLHAIMTQDFTEMFFQNVIDIKRYNSEASFYKDCIKDIKNADLLEYCYSGCYGRRTFDFKIQQLIDFI